MGEETVERRASRRVDLQTTATLLERGDPVGRFTVQNLSASGALLTGAHDVQPAAPLRLLLELPDGEPLAVGAHVRRRAHAGDTVALAVAFRHLDPASEDRIQDAVLSMLDASFRRTHPAVLVVDPAPDRRRALVAQVDGLGRRGIPCAAPLDAMRILEGGDPVAAVVARDGVEPHPELLSWVVENHPTVRSVLLVEDRSSDPPVQDLRVARCFPEDLGTIFEH